MLTVTEFLSGVFYNGLGRHEEALAAVGGAAHYSNDGPAIWALAELIEAAVRSEQPQLAGEALERIAETTRASGTDWALGVEARCRALLSEGDTAESLYREGIERLRRTSIRVDLARAHLHYGEWLRRKRRRRDAREQLRTAFELFSAMEIEAFAARAERELLATGERVRNRGVETRDELTPQEAQIARLARDNLSNADIGERLFISQHTVAYHLRKVFSKLDVTSRNQLERVLPVSATPQRPGLKTQRAFHRKADGDGRPGSGRVAGHGDEQVAVRRELATADPPREVKPVAPGAVSVVEVANGDQARALLV